MCGILLVKSKNKIPLDNHLHAFGLLKKRGPDFDRYRYVNNIFIGQTVLHITGDSDYYNNEHQNFLSYNGEIYNFTQFGNYSNDIEFVDNAVNNDLNYFKHAWGPWAWAWTNNNIVRYASDPQGEKCLYQYQDNDILIVCSEISPILEYIDPIKSNVPYENKTWTMLNQTPWAGIKKIEPGVLYQDGQAVEEIDTVWNWVDQEKYNTFEEAYEDFRDQWHRVITLMTPDCQSGLTYSGGLDSGIILSHLDNLDLYTVNCMGKDPIVDCINEFLTPAEQQRLHLFHVDEQQWAQALQELIKATHMPAQSWSFASQWIAIKNCKQRVLFTGAGADELFGGYSFYQDIDYDLAGSHSPFSTYGDDKIWQRCLQVYNNDPRPATMLMDYWYQVVGCDARAVDQITGQWGIEARNPFLAKPIMQLALNLPIEYKIGSVSKPLIRKLFLERWPEHCVFPKKGFTGHANDALPWLNIEINHSGDRMNDWRQIAEKSFYEST